jgi:hypothetical protein
VTGAYVAVWIVALIAGFAGAWIGDANSSTDDWAALGGAILGFFVGLVVGHLVWIALTTRVLGPFGRTARTVIAVSVPPVCVVAFFRSIPELGWSVLAFPIVAPAALSWWATEPA